jgi:alpha-tubulin suppressor-like RCC1 family protein
MLRPIHAALSGTAALVVLASLLVGSPASAVTLVERDIFVEVDATEHFSLGLTDDGRVFAWGDNGYGQLGDRTRIGRSSPVAVTGLPLDQEIIAISAGYLTSYALSEAGQVYSWGYGGNGQLGDGMQTTDYDRPHHRVTAYAVSIPRPVVQIDANGHAIARTVDGEVYVWGSNGYWQLGLGTSGTTTRPVKNLSVSGAIDVAAGGSHSVVLTTSGALYAMGDNDSKQLGIVDNTTAYYRHPTLVTTVPTGVTPVGVEAGEYNTWILGDDARTYGVGAGQFGQLARGSLMAASSDTFAAAVTGASSSSPPLADVVDIAVGRHHVAARQADGDVYTWGTNIRGQIGDGTTVQRMSAFAVSGVADAIDIAAGDRHTLAVLGGGVVAGWGSVESGQLGDGVSRSVEETVRIPGLSGIEEVSAGPGYSLARRQDGRVYAWGRNDEGLLGDGATTERATPTLVPGVTGVTSISAGDDHVLAAAGSTVWAWGRNHRGQLGDGTTTQRLSPVQVLLPERIVQVAAGGPSDYYWDASANSSVDGGFSLALGSSGKVYGWGAGDFGQNGDGDSGSDDFTDVPTVVTGVNDVVAIAAGRRHSMALTADGIVYQWGRNDLAQSGQPTATKVLLVPTPIAADEYDVTDIDAGYDHSLAATSEGLGIGWGTNSASAIATSNRTLHDTPQAQPDLGTVTRVEGGDRMSYFVTAAGELWVRGDNENGQLGHGAEPDQAPLTRLPLPGPVEDVSVATLHSLVVIDGEVWTWGLNSTSALGFTTPDSSVRPAPRVAPDMSPGDPIAFGIVVTGESVVGATIAADITGLAPADAQLGYSWKADGITVPGAKSATLTIPESLLGSRLSVKVTATAAGRADTRRTSLPLAPVERANVDTPPEDTAPENTPPVVPGPGADPAPPPAPEGNPPTVVPSSFAGLSTVRVKGRLTAGKKLRVTTAKVIAQPSGARYRWFADGKRIRKADSSTLKVTKSLARKKGVTVKVTLSRADYVTWTTTLKVTRPRPRT